MNLAIALLMLFLNNLLPASSFHSLLSKIKSLNQPSLLFSMSSSTSSSNYNNNGSPKRKEIIIDLESPNQISPQKKSPPFYCYLVSTGNKTYAGYTNNLTRRLRQHNQEIVGGARYTSSATNWTYLSIMTSTNWNKIRALQVEYLHKYPTRKKPRPSKFSRPTGRIRSLTEICSRIEEPIQLYIEDTFLESARADLLVFRHVQVLPLNIADIIVDSTSTSNTGSVNDDTIDLTTEE